MAPSSRGLESAAVTPAESRAQGTPGEGAHSTSCPGEASREHMREAVPRETEKLEVGLVFSKGSVPGGVPGQRSRVHGSHRLHLGSTRQRYLDHTSPPTPRGLKQRFTAMSRSSGGGLGLPWSLSGGRWLGLVSRGGGWLSAGTSAQTAMWLGLPHSMATGFPG